MEILSFTTNQDIIALLCQRLKEYRLAARIGMRCVMQFVPDAPARCL